MWLRHTSANERRAMLAAYAGYGLDGFDFMIYTFVIPTLIALWGMNKAEAGYIASAALLTSAVGGWGAGILADRFGRVRVLQLTVVWFALFTFLSGFTHSFGELLVTRALQGFGFGGEWSVGSLLVAETIEARHRGKAAGVVQSSWSVGWAAAALAFWAASTLLPPDIGWRVLFWIGILPALLIIYIRRNVREPAVYMALQASAAAGFRAPGSGSAFLMIFRPPLLLKTVLGDIARDRNVGRLLLRDDLVADVSQDRAAPLGDRDDRLSIDGDRWFSGRLPGQCMVGRRLGPPTQLHGVCVLRSRVDLDLHAYAGERRHVADRFPAGLLRAGHFFRHGRLLCRIVSGRRCAARARVSVTAPAAPSGPPARRSSVRGARTFRWVSRLAP